MSGFEPMTRQFHSKEMLLTLQTWSAYFERDLTRGIVYRSPGAWADYFVEGSCGIPTDTRWKMAYVVVEHEIPDPIKNQYGLRVVSYPHPAEQKGQSE